MVPAGIDIPRVFHTLEGEAVETMNTPYGCVGQLFSGDGIEAVWVSKEDDEIDFGWFVQSKVDLILVVQGRLKVEFERPDLAPEILSPGDLLVLPANIRCRAYRWPRNRTTATVFCAFYPVGQARKPL